MPAFDLNDIVNPSNVKRQGMPEFSQTVFENEIKQELLIGDYVNLPNNSIRINEEVRCHMITVISEIHRIKSYREETLHLAVSLADRFLALLTM